MFQVLSPDKITIEFENWDYKTKKKAIDAFVKWREAYRAQGYYSSRGVRIPLSELHNYCTWNAPVGKEISEDEIPPYQEMVN